jgi:hypothetical protein
MTDENLVEEWNAMNQSIQINRIIDLLDDELESYNEWLDSNFMPNQDQILVNDNGTVKWVKYEKNS